MNQIKNVALVGAGRVSAHHSKMLSDLADIELLAICDLNQETGKPLAQQYGVRWYDNYHHMLSEHPNIDIVTIATPS